MTDQPGKTLSRTFRSKRCQWRRDIHYAENPTTASNSTEPTTVRVAPMGSIRRNAVALTLAVCAVTLAGCSEDYAPQTEEERSLLAAAEAYLDGEGVGCNGDPTSPSSGVEDVEWGPVLDVAAQADPAKLSGDWAIPFRGQMLEEPGSETRGEVRLSIEDGEACINLQVRGGLQPDTQAALDDSGLSFD